MLRGIMIFGLLLPFNQAMAQSLCSDPRHSCTTWTPGMTGDVDRDKCLIAHLSQQALEDELTRSRGIADPPLPSLTARRTFIIAAANRVARDCDQAADAELQQEIK